MYVETAVYLLAILAIDVYFLMKELDHNNFFPI